MVAQNALAMLPMLAITVISGEIHTLRGVTWTARCCAALVASCLGGLGMSYCSFALRAQISATSFSVIGNVCKILTILVNLMMWEKHSSKLQPPSSAVQACRQSVSSPGGTLASPHCNEQVITLRNWVAWVTSAQSCRLCVLPKSRR